MTDHDAVQTRCLRYIVPFRYDGTFEDAVRQVDACEDGPLRWERQRSRAGQDSELFQYVRNEFSTDEAETLSDHKVGYAWTAAGQNRTSAKAPAALRELICLPNGQHDETGRLDIAICEAGLLLFRNQLGLFWYELALPAEGIDLPQLRWFQQHVKAIGNIKTPHLWEEQNHSRFDLAAWVQETIPVRGVRYFMEKGTSHLPVKTLLYTYASLQGEHAAPYDDIYHLANGYGPNIRYSEETARDIRQPFQDTYWYATQEGAAYLVWPNEANRQYYEGDFLRKARGDYFTLYLKVLYQSYSLLIYAERIQSEISAVKGSHLPEPADQNISALCSEINLFLVKSMATSVSHVHHQSEFYIYLKERLRIHDDVKSVTSGLNALDTLHREQDKIEEERAEREREQRDKASDTRIERGMTILSILSVFSALVDCFDFIAKFPRDGGEYWELPVVWQYVEKGCLLVIAALAVYLLVMQVRRAIAERRPDKR